jgi:hypothetical protein
LIRPLLEMLRLRSGPQDMPTRLSLALMLGAAYLAQGMWADRIMDGPDAAPRSVVAIAVQFGAVMILLQLRHLSARVPQTISALAGTGFLFGLASILLLSQLTPGEPAPGVAMAYFGLFFWSLAVDAHIYRHALSTNLSFGVMVAVLIFGLNFLVLRTAFG